MNLDQKIKYSRELFYWFSITIILFFILEIIFPGLVLAYFNINILVFLWLLNFLFFLFIKKS